MGWGVEVGGGGPGGRAGGVGRENSVGESERQTWRSLDHWY